MSTNHIIVPPISATELFDGRLEKFGVYEHVNEETTAGDRCLTDGANYLWVYVGDDDDDNNISSFRRSTRHGNPSRIFDAIFAAFDSQIYSEHEPQYHGFETREAWEAAMDAYNKKEDEEFLAEVVEFLRGKKRHGFVASGLMWASSIKKAFKKDPTLILPENHDKLLKLFHDIKYSNAITVQLSPEDVALAKMVATHEDDLPKA